MKIAIIGTGQVGANIAFALLLKNIRAEIILIDKNECLEEGQYLDLRDTTLFSEASVLRGDLPDASSADIIVVTAGTAQKAGEKRTELTTRNINILRSIKKEIGEIQKSAIVIIVANPVDILTQIASCEWGLPHGQVFGTGTLLDSARLRWHIAEKEGVHPSSVQGYVLGEHGQSEFVACSTVSVASRKCSIDRDMEELVRQEAFRIIECKGSTSAGIASCTAEIISSIIGDEKKILPVSVPLNGEYGITGISLGVPAVVGKNGAIVQKELLLPDSELKKLQSSANKLKKIMAES